MVGRFGLEFRLRTVFWQGIGNPIELFFLAVAKQEDTNV